MERRLQHPRIDPRDCAALALDRPAARAGFSLVEVVIAILLTAVIVTSVFSVALTSKTGNITAERRLKAAVGTRQVSSMLRTYVTGDQVDSGMNLPGPGSPPNTWSMTSPVTGIVDHFGTYPCGGARNDYALAPGDHCLTGVLGTFEAAPYNARVWYRVDDMAVGDPVLGPACPNCMLPSVTITATWIDP